MRKSFWKFFIMMIPAFILLIVFTYTPIIRGGVMAFQRYNMFDLSKIGFIGFGNFEAIINDRNFDFFKIVVNTLVWVFFSLVFQFGLGFGLALLMRKPFKGRGIYSALVFYPWAVSGFAIGLIWAWMFNGQFGIVNDILVRLGIISNPIGFLSNPKYAMMSVIIANVWYGIPYFAIMLLAALQSVPNELYEASRIDGANRFKQVLHPDLIVYLYADIDTLMNRIALRDRPFERRMDRTYISMLGDAYENYMKNVAESQVLRIDTSNIDFVRNPEDLKRVFERIEAIL